MRRASGESSTGTQDTLVAHLWFTTGLRHHETDSGMLLNGETVMAAAPMEIDAAYGDIGKKGKHAKGQKGKDKGKGKLKGNHEGSSNLEGCCGHCGKWGQVPESHVGALQLKVSVDQDLSVIVAETINDDDARRRLVPIVFTRA